MERVHVMGSWAKGSERWKSPSWVLGQSLGRGSRRQSPPEAEE